MSVISTIFFLILPLFLVMLTGKIFASKHVPASLVINTDRRGFIDKFVYNVTLPLALFISVSKLPVSSLNNVSSVMGAIIVTVISLFVIGFITAKIFYKAMGQASAITIAVNGTLINTVYLGIPVIESVANGNMELARLGSLYAAFVIPVTIMASLISLRIFGNNKNSSVVGSALKVLKDPPFIAVAVGIFFVITKLTLPSFVLDAFGMIGKITTGLILLSIGSRISLKLKIKDFLPISVAVLLRLVASPVLAFLSAKYLFSLSSLEVFGLTMMFAMPTAMASTVFLFNAGIEDQEINTAVIGITTVFIVVTIPLLTFLIKF